LNRVRAVCRKTLDRGDALAADGGNRIAARADGLTVDQHGAGAALRPQPYFVPESFRESRSTHNNGVSGSMSTVCAIPFTTIEIAISLLPFFPCLATAVQSKTVLG
jgi:hypothetical protein